MKHFIISILHFSRQERIGTILLTMICVAVFALPEIVRPFRSPRSADFLQFQSDIQAFRQAMQSSDSSGQSAAELFAFDPNTVSFDDLVRLGLSEKVANTICNYRSKGGFFRKPEDFQKIWSLKKEDYDRLLPYIQMESFEDKPLETKQAIQDAPLFAFDPNTATEQDFLRLGLPKWTIKSIVNYRSKGGIFRNKSDFQKIYTLDEQDYHRLEPYINIAVVAATEASRPAAYAGGGNGLVSNFAAKGLLDINRASVEDWQRLPGIGETRARQIVNFRESLGGFLSLEQLGEMRGLPDSVFQRIKPMLQLAAVEVRKINLNAAAAEDLEAHPYISGKQARLIVAYRQQHGSFASGEELSKIAAFTDRRWLEKLKPYLSVE